MKKVIAFVLLAGTLAWPQNIGVGKMLIAVRSLHDDDFAQTVILIVRHDTQATIGLFLNRPLTIPLSEVYPDMKGAQLKLYAGGPVTVGIRALYRSRTKPAEAAAIFDDVSMITKKTLLAELVGEGKPASVFRVYAGYVGWSGGQVRDEVARGLWHVVTADPGLIFDPHPETVWSRAIAKITSK